MVPRFQAYKGQQYSVVTPYIVFVDTADHDWGHIPGLYVGAEYTHSLQSPIGDGRGAQLDAVVLPMSSAAEPGMVTPIAGDN